MTSNLNEFFQCDVLVLAHYQVSVIKFVDTNNDLYSDAVIFRYSTYNHYNEPSGIIGNFHVTRQDGLRNTLEEIIHIKSKELMESFKRDLLQLK